MLLILLFDKSIDCLKKCGDELGNHQKEINVLQVLELLKHRSGDHRQLIVAQENLHKFVVNSVECIINSEKFIILKPQDLHRAQSLHQVSG